MGLFPGGFLRGSVRGYSRMPVRTRESSWGVVSNWRRLFSAAVWAVVIFARAARNLASADLADAAVVLGVRESR